MEFHLRKWKIYSYLSILPSGLVSATDVLGRLKCEDILIKIESLLLRSDRETTIRSIQLTWTAYFHPDRCRVPTVIPETISDFNFPPRHLSVALSKLQLRTNFSHITHLLVFRCSFYVLRGQIPLVTRRHVEDHQIRWSRVVKSIVKYLAP